MNKHEEYRAQVALLLRIMPYVFRIKDFAVHGGTAINLFHRDMPRYSVDIDLTYIPLEERMKSLAHINELLAGLKTDLLRYIPGIRIVHKTDVWKLLCTLNGSMVKIEVNGTKRGLLGLEEVYSLCEAGQKDFGMTCKARTVSFTQLFGGKIAASLSRQHPRDLFDCKYMMETCTFDDVRDGLLFCLAGSDKPIVESILPHDIDQHDALEQQFAGMTDMEFSYEEYECTRNKLHEFIFNGLTDKDKSFLLSFEKGDPDWTLLSVGDLSKYPSVQWKLLNISKLKTQNRKKFEQGVEILQKALEI